MSKKVKVYDVVGKSIPIGEAVHRAWRWIKPYFDAQGVCNSSQSALYELLKDSMYLDRNFKKDE